MKRLQIVLVLGFLLLAVTAQAQKVIDASPVEVHDYINTTTEKFLILDVRTIQEYSEGHIAGAEFFPVSASSFKRSVFSLPKNVTYVVYCRSGNRSQHAKKIMKDAGLSLIHLDGGIRAWKRAGFSI
ncbi:rhodanese-like domain-containing protein [Halodesulfovibrio sp. MK-HDV]|jgi:phage shock protein E|uniref:rhodanese-like domain-containing protein n=1 Tax=Halodesulfovibrio sp. MK-HDV TaxID=2599925 RepID=UPI00136B9D2D|nr:rhodanese-like domain-containing protein [Halodesulfovibrio sp. MK-HDV]KAF1075864.1 putative adenylyltransferase/sulfurtransferase MoeZ [Halodesulfovibrio sp. MK-HDV]